MNKPTIKFRALYRSANKEDALAKALEALRDWRNDPSLAELPWNSSIVVNQVIAPEGSVHEYEIELLVNES